MDMTKGLLDSLFPCCMDTRSLPKNYVVNSRGRRSQQLLNREKIKLAKQASQKNFIVKEIARTYEKPVEPPKKAMSEFSKPIVHLMAVNKFKSLRHRRINRENQARIEAENSGKSAPEPLANVLRREKGSPVDSPRREKKKENRISVQSIPEDGIGWESDAE